MFRCSGSALSGALDFCSWPSGATLRTPEWSTASGIGGFGGGLLEHLRQWLGAQWPDLSPWASRAVQSRQARPEEAQESS